MKIVNKYTWIQVYEVKRGKRYKKYMKVLTQPDDSREALHTASINNRYAVALFLRKKVNKWLEVQSATKYLTFINMLKADGFDKAIIGQTYDMVVSEERLIYSVEKCVEILENETV